MLRISLIFGIVAGVLVVIPMLAGSLLAPPEAMMEGGHLLGYSVMLVALSLIFLGVKRYRDRALGGVITFWRALVVGLGISVVAGVVYVAGWELTLALTDYQFMETYTRIMIDAERAKGVTGAELEAFVARMTEMAEMYRNPLFRMPVTFVEIFPVGLLISLISAALLRNSRFLPARRPPAAA